MKEIALQVAGGSPSQKLNVLREYIQNEILLILQTSGFSDHLYFVGGTALRFLYGAKRFSEDIDFAAGPTWRKGTLGTMAAELNKELTLSGYAAEVRFKEEKMVARAFAHFGHILQEAALSRRKGQVLSVNIEVDTNPPAGWVEERTIVNHHFPVLLRHYDRPSLFAAKIAAFLMRPYTKGRDVYDLIWFRSKWPDLEPNLTLLNNALSQKRKVAGRLTRRNWLATIADKASTLDWKDVVRDVSPFLEDPREVALLTPEGFRLLFRA
jgi:predicted nucleotidyltransferase component of viral defense system